MNCFRQRPAAVLVTAGCAAGLAVAAAMPATAAVGRAASAASGICRSAKHPMLAARISKGIAAALAGRADSFVGMAASDAAEDLTCKLRETDHFYAASVIKVTIISSLLRKVGGPAGMTRAQHDLAYQMITQSSNSAAQKLWKEVGIDHVQDFLTAVGMRHTILNNAWGLTLLTPQDELTLLDVLTTKGKVLSNSSRGYVLWLMSKVIPSERWGVSADAPSGVTVHIKNGWLPYPGAIHREGHRLSDRHPHRATRRQEPGRKLRHPDRPGRRRGDQQGPGREAGAEFGRAGTAESGGACRPGRLTSPRRTADSLRRTADSLRRRRPGDNAAWPKPVHLPGGRRRLRSRTGGSRRTSAVARPATNWRTRPSTGPGTC